MCVSMKDCDISTTHCNQLQLKPTTTTMLLQQYYANTTITLQQHTFIIFSPMPVIRSIACFEVVMISVQIPKCVIIYKWLAIVITTSVQQLYNNTTTIQQHPFYALSNYASPQTQLRYIFHLQYNLYLSMEYLLFINKSPSRYKNKHTTIQPQQHNTSHGNACSGLLPYITPL